MIRFGILAGVSTDVQAGDKASIPDQIATCRRAIAQLGAVEIDCFTMDGYSRTGYDSLADAMNDIPPLKEAIVGASLLPSHCQAASLSCGTMGNTTISSIVSQSRSL